MGIRRQNSVGTGYWLQCTWLGESEGCIWIMPGS